MRTAHYAPQSPAPLPPPPPPPGSRRSLRRSVAAMLLRVLFARAFRLLPGAAPRRPVPIPVPPPVPSAASPPSLLSRLPFVRFLSLRRPAGLAAMAVRRARAGPCMALALGLALLEPPLEEQRRARAVCGRIQVWGWGGVGRDDLSGLFQP